MWVPREVKMLPGDDEPQVERSRMSRDQPRKQRWISANRRGRSWGHQKRRRLGKREVLVWALCAGVRRSTMMLEMVCSIRGWIASHPGW